MSSILSLSFGSLIAVALLLVLGFTIVGATRNTVNLLRERAELGISLIAKEVDTHLQAARNQASFIAGMVESGKIDVADRDRLATLMFGAMAADPAIGAVAFVFPDGEAEVVDRLADPARHYRAQLGSDPLVRRGLRYGRSNVRPVWLPPAYRPDIERTILTFERPVRRNGEFLGVLASVISVGSLSERLKSAFGTLGSNVFVLYGKDRVLAHSLMAAGYPGLTVETPLPTVAGFEDPILAAMWNSASIRPLRIDLDPPLQGSRGRNRRRRSRLRLQEDRILYRRADLCRRPFQERRSSPANSNGCAMRSLSGSLPSPRRSSSPSSSAGAWPVR